MNGMQKAGGCLTLTALPFLSLAVMMFASPPKGDTPLEALVPGLFFASVVLLPGLALWSYGSKVRRQREFEESVTSLVRSHDRFSVGELAQKIGRSELETEVLINRIAHRDRTIDLVFHRPSRQYIHRARLQGGQIVVDACPRCGAPSGGAVVFPGEQLQCLYCGAPLVAGR